MRAHHSSAIHACNVQRGRRLVNNHTLQILSPKTGNLWLALLAPLPETGRADLPMDINPAARRPVAIRAVNGMDEVAIAVPDDTL